MLRSRLLATERSSEELREQMNELLMNKERLTSEVDELQQDNARLELTANKCVELQEAYQDQGFR